MKEYKATGIGNLLIINQKTFSKVYIPQIMMLKSDVNYTIIYLEGGKTKVIARPLKFFEEYLTLHGFLRVHRSFLINPQYITEHNLDNHFLVMKDGSVIAIARRRKRAFCTKAMLNSSIISQRFYEK